MLIALGGKRGFGKFTEVDDDVWQQVVAKLGYVPIMHLDDAGYARLWESNSKSKIRLHRLIWTIIKGQTDCVLHHKDDNKLNNKLGNIEAMTAVEHNRSSFRKPTKGSIKLFNNKYKNPIFVARFRYKGISYRKHSISIETLENWIDEQKKRLQEVQHPVR